MMEPSQYLGDPFGVEEAGRDTRCAWQAHEVSSKTLHFTDHLPASRSLCTNCQAGENVPTHLQGHTLSQDTASGPQSLYLWAGGTGLTHLTTTAGYDMAKYFTH